MEMLYTYVLQLEQGKWYVGKTNDPLNRLLQHVKENGSAWTRKYPPVQVHEVKPFVTKYDEENTTCEYMERYGINNVRGGCYVQVILPPEQIREIERKRASVNDACFKCGVAGHTVADCHEDDEDSCTRCGRDSHNASNCYAKTHVDGGLPREARPKKSKTKPKKQRETSPDCCKRCGRNTHDASSCYAKTHANGGSLGVNWSKKSKSKRENSYFVEPCMICGRPGGYEVEDCDC